MNKIFGTIKGKSRISHELTKTYLDIDWKHCYSVTFKLQQKIAVAWNMGNYTKALDHCKTLVNTFEARAIAVRNVCSNKGAKTAGVDGVIWNTTEEKFKAIQELKD